MTIQPFERVSQADSKLNFVVYYKHFLLHLRKLHIFCGEQSIIIWRDSQSSQHGEVLRSWLPGYVSSGAMESNLSGSGKSITAKVSRHLFKVRVNSAIIKPPSFRVLFHSWNKSLSLDFFSFCVIWSVYIKVCMVAVSEEVLWNLCLQGKGLWG